MFGHACIPRHRTVICEFGFPWQTIASDFNTPLPFSIHYFKEPPRPSKFFWVKKALLVFFDNIDFYILSCYNTDMPKLIKNYKCFDNQLESAEEAINYFFASNNYSHVVLAAQTQQGKTGTGIATIEKYLTSINNKKVLYLFNHSDNDSADDIQSDLSDAGYYNEKSKTNPVEFFKLGSGERGFESLTKSLENNSVS